MAIEETQPPARIAGEVGWHLSQYIISAPVPGTDNVAIANLFKGTCAVYTPLELNMLSIIEELDERYPMIERFARRGAICNFDERAALETLGRMACAVPHEVTLVICPTMGCNFDCPYCFETHTAGKMSADVQDDVVALAERMLDVTGSKDMAITWFGGEPLLAPDIIESLSERLMALVDERGRGQIDEVGDPNRFDDAHQLMAYAGMDPTKSESGETVASDGSMSKRGPVSLRWAFMEAADCVRRFDRTSATTTRRRKARTRSTTTWRSRASPASSWAYAWRS